MSFRLAGRLIALVFGLTMFLEVACLPWVSAFATEVEKSMVAELDEEEIDEVERSEFQLLHLAFLPAVPLLFDWSNFDAATPVAPLSADLASTQIAPPAFILYHSLLI